MSDLLAVLPAFPTSKYTHLIPSLEKNLITISDLLTLDVLDVAKRAQLPVLDLRHLVAHITQSLQADLGIALEATRPGDDLCPPREGRNEAKVGLHTTSLKNSQSVSLLDPVLDAALSGGIRTGYLTEITGESGVGKTQFLLTLLLSVQLPGPKGLGRSSLYVSTEAPLSTRRLAQILQSHPQLQALPPDERPTLENVRAVPCGDIEAQDHILEYQLPAAIEKFDVGLVVLDSVAANYRAEHGSSVPKDLADRAIRLAKLGHLLRRLAVTKNIAVVVANQVSDRMDDRMLRPSQAPPASLHSSSPIPVSSPGPSQVPHVDSEDPVLTLDHQQRFFTGWGDEGTWATGLKTPALGLGWTNQIACRIALKMGGSQLSEPVILQSTGGQAIGGNLWSNRRSKRSMKIVFSPWTADDNGGQGAEYEITAGGISAIG